MLDVTISKDWQDLLRAGSFINGAFCEGAAQFDVVDPATGAILASVHDARNAELNAAIDAADFAFSSWSSKTATERAGFLRAWHAEITAHADPLAELLTREQGKPLAEAKAEIAYASSFVSWFAEEARRAYGETIPTDRPGREYLVVQEPVGVCAAITPWNFPSAMITRKVAPAIAAGCTVVVKPAAETPLSALALAVLAERAGAPKGLINIVVGTDAVGLGKTLCDDMRVRKLSFTGSTRVGRILAEQSGATVKRLSLELGGNAPFIVFADANLDDAIEGLMASKFRNSGQTCVCANRVYLEAPIADAFHKRLLERMGQLHLGHGLDQLTTQGPLISKTAKARVEELIADACAKGAQRYVTCSENLGDLFLSPTLLADVNADMSIKDAEIFGPVIATQTFTTEEDALRMANSTDYGLAAYVFTSSVSRSWRMARRMQCGMVAINEGIMSTAAGPFGGVGQSGYGREGAKQGLSCSIPDDHIDPRRSALFMARSILNEVRDGRSAC